MLNPSFSKEFSIDTDSYVLPENLIAQVIRQNTGFDTGPELRLQKVYEFEIWKKITSLNLEESNFNGKKVLDVCAGTGLLSFHLLSRIQPLDITLLDISAAELDRAKQLIDARYPHIKVNYMLRDLLQSNIQNESYDVIIGNSFLHHFYNIPLALKEFIRMLKPGGIFISLHEPTPSAIALESGSWKWMLKYLVKGEALIESIRYKGKGVLPGGGADVWMFNKDKFMDLCKTLDFYTIKCIDWHLLRPFLVAFKALHLNPGKKFLSLREEKLLEKSIKIDQVLSRILPSRMFGSFCVLLQKAKA